LSTNIAYDFIEAGYRIFGLQGADSNGLCLCGNPECKAAFKHPVASNWQHTPEWSEEQLETMQEMGQLDTGYGVIVKDLLVVDVDARNGGVQAMERLTQDLAGLDLARSAGLSVITGSGQGSMHIYYKAPEGISLVQGHPDYKGIDFKSSGFVVGPGSMHASGNTYEILHGSPADIGDAPAELIALLTRPDMFRAEYNGSTMDVTENDLAEMISHVSPDVDHDTWVKCGMALHHATGGTGFHLWDRWSSMGETYPGSHKLQNRWHSFGKSANPVTLGTLIHHAEAGGWVESVTFTPTGEFADELDAVVEGCDVKPVDKKRKDGHPFHVDGVDLLRPPGFVGEVCKWINEQSRYPRENLAVAAALVSMSNVIGLRYTDDVDGVTANLFAMCVAGSATGKEAIMQAINSIHQAAGIQRATVGSIKSEQEIIRNLIDNQAANYVIDEFGILLRTITTSKESYHSGVIGALMNAYSKANSFMPLTGDTKREVRKTLIQELKSCRKAISENDDPKQALARRLPHLERALLSIDNGLEKPYLTLIGFTTPVTFDSLVTPEQATNGFIGRSIIVSEKETNPRAKPNFKASKMGDRMKMAICGLYDGGYFDQETYRVEYYGERSLVRTEHEARDMLDEVYEWGHQKAEMHKEKTGLEAIPRRAREMVSKISLILAAPSGIRTAEHIRWAYAFVERDIREKTMLAYANEREEANPSDAIRAKVMTMVDTEHGETKGVIVNRCRKWPKEKVDEVIRAMVEAKMLILEESKNPANGRMVERYFGV
jgi:hypothetical protein